MKTPIKRYVVLPDLHGKYVSMPALACATRAIEVVKPTGVILLGDVGEFEHAGHWQWKKKRRPPLEYQLPLVDQDIEDTLRVMDIIDESCDKANVKDKHLTGGNHDDWLDRLVEENPYLTEYLFKEAMGLKERGYKFHQLGELLKIGKLYYYHGHLHGGKYHANNHLTKMGCNVLYGHWHDIQQSSVTHVDGAKSAWSIGCLKRMDRRSNEWLGGRQHNWGHAFAVVDYFSGGLFTVNVINIINGKCSLWGTLLNGNRGKR